jgi:hypothetical protein
VSTVVDRRIPANGRTLTLLAPRLSSPLRRLPVVRPHRYGDPLLVGLVALVVYALHGYDGVLDRDLGVFTYGGEQVAHGVPPYVGIFNSVGPLADAVPGLAIWLGHFAEADPILSARLLFTVLSALCCSLLCVLARDTLGSRTAGFVAPAVFLTFECFLKLASGGPREKTTMVVFVLACMILLGRRRWAAAGACAALATLTWQPAFAVAVAGIAAAAMLDEQDTRRRILLRFTIGGAVPSLATSGYFLGAGALSRAVGGFIVINLRYTDQPSVLTMPGPTWQMLWLAYGWTLLLVVAGIGALLVLGARAVPFARRPTVSPVARRLVVTASGALVGTGWTLLVVNGGPDLFVVLPFAALGIAASVVLLLGRLPRRAALAGAAAVVSVAVVVAGVMSVTTRDDRLLAERADIEAVLGTQPSDATVVTISAPQVLALSGRQSPVPYQIFSGTMERYLAGTYPGGMEGFMAELRHLHPTFVVVGSTFHGFWPYPWLERNYRRIGGGATFTWYIRSSAGSAALQRARTAHDEALAAFGS